MNDRAAPEDLDLGRLRDVLSPFGIRIAARRIQLGDEDAFEDNEASLPRRRASGAARLVARSLLARLGADSNAPLARRSSGAPVWPDGLVGSLAHDELFAAAVAGRAGRFQGLGVDIEPAEPLPDDVAELVLKARERLETEGDDIGRRLVFAAKEAVYKAVHPFDGTPLEFEDIETRLGKGLATIRDGRRLRLFVARHPRLVAVAVLEAPKRVFSA